MGVPEGFVRLSLQEGLDGGRARCLVCPRRCVIPEGGRGVCRTKVNVGGVIYEVNYGRVSSVAMDPVEKKPLFHFHPGSWAYSIGTVGCNLLCLHCQNWYISQPSSNPEEFRPLRRLFPEEAVEEALRLDATSIAYTYNEPTIVSFEWVRETARRAREVGLKNVSVTNGYWSEEALRELAPLMDAANVDVKAFTDRFYREVCGGASLGPVLETVKGLVKAGVHVELTYLVIPGRNDSEEEVRRFASWVASEVGADTPVHFSRFHPDFRMLDVPPTPLSTLERCYEAARGEGLRYVYLGNVPGHRLESTFCPECGEALIVRRGFDVVRCNLSGGRCPSCGAEVPVVGECRVSDKTFYLGLF